MNHVDTQSFISLPALVHKTWFSSCVLKQGQTRTKQGQPRTKQGQTGTKWGQPGTKQGQPGMKKGQGYNRTNAHFLI